MTYETGVGLVNPMFFVGVVENNLDPRLERRVQVRAFGVHGTNEQIPTQDLPWANLVVGSHDINFVSPPINSWVFGFFIDGRDAQQPMILGIIPTQFIEPINPSVTGWGVSFGNELDHAGHGSRAVDMGQPRNSRLDRGEDLQNTYIPVVEANRVKNIPIAGGTSASFAPKGNIGVGSQDEPAEPVDPGVLPSGPIANDAEFQAVLSEMLAKYPGLTAGDIYRVIQGESSFNPQALNASGAAGLFQFMPSVARELGTSTSQILAMKPADQLRLYDKYLQRWGYRGGSLGIMQAAPAFADNPPDSVVYPVGSPAWQQNPGWRTSNDGPITVASVNAYYDKRPAPSAPTWNSSGATQVADNNQSYSGQDTEGTVWEEPAVGYNAKYPYNRVIETAAGHSVELDDTPGSERIMIYHKSGSYIQITNSSSTRKSMEDAYDIFEDNFMLYVGGNHMVTIEGDCHVLVKGNKVEEIMGDYKQIVHGNHILGVAGQANINASEEVQIRAGRLGFEANVENINFMSAKQIKGTATEQIHFKTKNMFNETEEGMNFKTGKQIYIEAAESVNLKTAEEIKIMSEGNMSITNSSGELSIKSNGKISLDTDASIEVKSTGKTNISATGSLNIKAGTTLYLESVGTTNIKNQITRIQSSSVTDIKAGGNIRMQGANVYIDGGTVYLDDYVSMAGGSTNPPSGADSAEDAAPTAPAEAEAATAAQPATAVKLGEPPAKEIGTSPATNFQANSGKI